MLDLLNHLGHRLTHHVKEKRGHGITLLHPFCTLKIRINLIINFHINNTMMQQLVNLRAPLRVKTLSSTKTKKKIPINFIVRFFEIDFENNANLLFYMHMMHNFMHGKNIVHQVSIVNEGILLHTKQLGSIRF
jgi:hypothetical protein